MSQPPPPTDSMDPLFPEDAEPDGSPTRSPTLTFYGSRQMTPLQRMPGTAAPHGSQGPALTALRPTSQDLAPTTLGSDPLPPSTRRTGVPQPVTPRGILQPGAPHSATIPAVGAHRQAPSSTRKVPGNSTPDEPTPQSAPTSQGSQVPRVAPNSATIPDKFLITEAWLSGVLVGVIAHSLARGDSWKTGPLREASGPHVIWLRPGVPDEAQVAAWLVNSDKSSSQP